MEIFGSYYNERYHSDFKAVCDRQDERIIGFENVINDFLREVKSHKTPTKFMLHWQYKFSDCMNYHFDYNDEYIITLRKLRKVEDTVREFIDKVKNQDNNFNWGVYLKNKTPKHKDKIVAMNMFVEFMNQLEFMKHWQSRFFDSMNMTF